MTSTRVLPVIVLLLFALNFTAAAAETTTPQSNLTTSSLVSQQKAPNSQTTSSLKDLVSLSDGAQTTPPLVAKTTETLKRNYDQIAPDEDATTRSYSEVTAVAKDRERIEWLRSAAISDDYEEDKSADFRLYRNLVPGNEDDPGEGARFVPTRDIYGASIGRQPVGPLSGRIIYASAGHGWTNDNTSTSLWYTQRPITYGMIEDFGNLDQMNLYADLCFRAGATIVPIRPLGFQHVERVIDNVSEHAGFHGEWADSQSTASFGFAGAEIPYRFARAAAEESSVARFRPVIPITDRYPVYCWARAGADRVIQTYRVVHAGGVNEVDIDHRKVGNGWVYLGSYMFEKGNGGYVEITNRVRDPQLAAEPRVVIADAIRFGNGMGDVNRGGGISRHPREEESSRYWTERGIAEAVPPIYDAFKGEGDQGNNVGSAPRYAAHMNRETNGDFFDRLFMSFHSNAVGGRGVMGLYNAHAILRPDHQIELAKLVADELNAEMTSVGLQLNDTWNVRPVRTQAHINFGEIRKDYLNNEMSATIVEVAFHDNAEDAALMRLLSVREAMAESAYRATLRYFAEVGKKDVKLYTPPSPPVLRYAVQSAKKGAADLAWSPATEDPLSSKTGAIRYKIYQSKDGLAFDDGTDVGSRTEYTLQDLNEQEPVYVRVNAVSDGGESKPSTVLGVSVSSGPRVLIVQGAPTVLDDSVLSQTEEAHLGWPLRDGGSFVRLVPHIMNNREQIRTIGAGIDRLNVGFESMDMATFLTQAVIPQKYHTIAIQMGRSPIPDELATTKVLTGLHDHITSNGRLLLSGACLAECEGLQPDSLARWGAFVTNALQTGFDPQTTLTKVIKSGDRDLTTVTLNIGSRSLRYFEPRPTEVLSPLENGRPVLAYDSFKGIAAVATLKEKALRTVTVGFPLEELDDRQEQEVLVAQILTAMGLEIQPAASLKITTTDPSESKVKITDAKPGTGKAAGAGK